MREASGAAFAVIPRGPSAATNALSTSSSERSGEGLPGWGRCDARPSIDTPWVYPAYTSAMFQPGAWRGPAAYVMSSRTVTAAVPAAWRAVATWAARSPSPALPATAVGFPLPRASRESPPATTTISEGVRPWTTRVGSVLAGSRVTPTARAVRILAVDAGTLGFAVSMSSRCASVKASRTLTPSDGPRAGSDSSSASWRRRTVGAGSGADSAAGSRGAAEAAGVGNGAGVKVPVGAGSGRGAAAASRVRIPGATSRTSRVVYPPASTATASGAATSRRTRPPRCSFRADTGHCARA